MLSFLVRIVNPVQYCTFEFDVDISALNYVHLIYMLILTIPFRIAETVGYYDHITSITACLKAEHTALNNAR